MSSAKPEQYPLSEVLKAQAALRAAAELPSEVFPVQSFIGMVSDEIETLRRRGMGDDEIAAVIRGSSSIEVDASTIAENYASPEDRHSYHEES